MPQIPEYKSNTQIQNPNLPNMPSNVNNVGQGITNEIENIEDTMVKVRDFRQTNEADVFASDAINDVILRSQQDESLDSKKYEQELTQIGESAAQTITGSLAREQFMANFGNKSLVAKNRIKQDYYSKELDSAKAILTLKSQNLADEVAGMDELQKHEAILNYRQSLDQSISMGLFTKEQADLELKKTIDGMNKSIVTNDILNDNSTQEEDSQVLAELRSTDKNSKYADISFTEKLKFIEDAQRRIFSNNQKFKREVTDSQQMKLDDVTNKLIEGTLTLTDLEKEAQVGADNGGLSPTQIDQKRKQIMARVEYNLKVVTKNDQTAKKYNDFFRKFIDNKIDREKALELLADAYTDGHLSNEEAKQLGQLKQYSKDIAFTRDTERKGLNFNKVINWITKGAKSEKETALQIKDYLNTVNGSQNIDVDTDKFIHEQTKKDRLQKLPWMSSLPKDGELRQLPDGTIKRFFPDGRIEDK